MIDPQMSCLGTSCVSVTSLRSAVAKITQKADHTHARAHTHTPARLLILTTQAKQKKLHNAWNKAVDLCFPYCYSNFTLSSY